MSEGGTAYGWTDNGNLMSKAGEASYEWDFEDRLVKVVKADGTVVENEYDVDGVMVKTVVTPSGGTAQTTDLLVDTSGGLSHVVAEVDASGTVSVVYVRAGDMLLEEIRGGVAKMYEADGLGSVRSLLDVSGAKTDAYTYEAFGSTLSSIGTDENPYRFAGERFVCEVGMYQNRARWLDTGVGRFTTYDHRFPTGYVYTHADPVNYSDPTGHMEFTLTGLMTTMSVGAVIGGSATYYSNRALGKAQTFSSIMQGAALGAAAAPIAVWAPMAGAVLGVSGAVFSAKDYGPILADSSIPLDRRIAAASLIIAGLYGARAGIQYANEAASNPAIFKSFDVEKIAWLSWSEYPKVTVNGQEYAVVGGRLFSWHAVARMQPSGMRYSGSGADSPSNKYPQIQQAGGPEEFAYTYGRSVAPQYVEDTIASSPGVLQANGNISHLSGSLRVILNKDGAVVTIITE
jgi:RHS repeat-associated protein